MSISLKEPSNFLLYETVIRTLIHRRAIKIIGSGEAKSSSTKGYYWLSGRNGA
jgi:hypothetical protein